MGRVGEKGSAFKVSEENGPWPGASGGSDDG